MIKFACLTFLWIPDRFLPCRKTLSAGIFSLPQLLRTETDEVKSSDGMILLFLHRQIRRSETLHCSGGGGGTSSSDIFGRLHHILRHKGLAEDENVLQMVSPGLRFDLCVCRGWEGGSFAERGSRICARVCLHACVRVCVCNSINS